MSSQKLDPGQRVRAREKPKSRTGRLPRRTFGMVREFGWWSLSWVGALFVFAASVRLFGLIVALAAVAVLAAATAAGAAASPTARSWILKTVYRYRFVRFVSDWKWNADQFGWSMKSGERHVVIPRLVSASREGDRWYLVVKFPHQLSTKVPVLVGSIPEVIVGCHASEFWPYEDERYGAGLVEVRLSFRPFPRFLEFDKGAAARLVSSSRVWIGRTAVGDEAEIDLAVEPTWLIAGRRGSGKSALGLSILAQLVNKVAACPVPEDRTRIVVIDFKRDAKYQRLRRYGVRLIHDLAETTNFLEATRRELDHRSRVADAAGLDRYPGPDLIIYFDELARLTTDQTIDQTVRQRNLVAIVEIAEMGRSLGLKMLALTQSGSPQVIGGAQVMTNMKASAIGLGDLGDFATYLFGADPDLRYLSGHPGRGVVRGAAAVDNPGAMPTDVRGLQVGYIDYVDLDKVLLPLPTDLAEAELVEISEGAPAELGPESRTLVEQMRRRA